MENYIQNQAILVTPCNHSFHHECIMNWVKAESIKVEKDRIRNQIHNIEPSREEERPGCPNCGQSILKKAEEVEKTAVLELNNVLG